MSVRCDEDKDTLMYTVKDHHGERFDGDTDER